MRSIIDILLDDSDASIALSRCIAGVVALSTDAVSDSSRAVAASTRAADGSIDGGGAR